MIISLIVAMDEHGGIGKDNQLPWYLPSDLKRFKRITMGHHIVMGRKTYEAISKPLPGRVTIILSHQEDYAPKDCMIAHSLGEAIKIAETAHESECFIIGGGEIFQQTLDMADKLYLTTVFTKVDADVWFPEIKPVQWSIESSEPVGRCDQDEYQSEFKILLRSK